MNGTVDLVKNGAKGRFNRLFCAILLVLSVWFAFQPAMECGFVNYDDDIYISENRNIRDGWSRKAVFWAFTTFHAANWHPVTWLSHMTDMQLFGLNPAGHHLSSVVIHIGNTLLLFALLLKMTGGMWPSFLTAVFFGIHPLHVESVAWVSERKDVLSTFWGLASLWCYAGWAMEGGRWRYLMSIAWFAVGLGSKPMLVTWPFVMLLLDWWPLCRMNTSRNFHGMEKSNNRSQRVLKRLLVEKIPFFTLSCLSCVVTVWAQRAGGAVAPMEMFSIGERISNAIVGTVFYLGKIVFPVNLAFFYPHPGQRPAWQVLMAFTILVAGFWGSLRLIRKKPYVATGWCWYIGTLVPVSGLVQVGVQAQADRYSYIPLIGIFLIIAWGMADAGRKVTSKWLMSVVSLTLVLVCLLLTRIQVRTWQDSWSLMTHAIQAVDGNYVAHHNLGALHMARGNMDEAIRHFHQALKFQPDDSGAHTNLGVAFARIGRSSDAIRHFRAAMRINPNFCDAYTNLGVLLSEKGRERAAVHYFKQASQCDPENEVPHIYAGMSLLALGNTEGSIVNLKQALDINPDNAIATKFLKRALAAKKLAEDRERQLEKLLNTQSYDIKTLIQAGLFYSQQRKLKRAEKLFSNVLELEPANVTALGGLADIFSRTGKYADSINLLKQIVEQPQARPEIFYRIGSMYARQNKAEKAFAWIKKAEQSGYETCAMFSMDPEFDEIRETPGGREMKIYCQGPGIAKNQDNGAGQ